MEVIEHAKSASHISGNYRNIQCAIWDCHYYKKKDCNKYTYIQYKQNIFSRQSSNNIWYWITHIWNFHQCWIDNFQSRERQFGIFNVWNYVCHIWFHYSIRRLSKRVELKLERLILGVVFGHLYFVYNKVTINP